MAHHHTYQTAIWKGVIELEQIIGLRWFSIMNDFMDCVVFVQAKNREQATKAILYGIEEFWKEDDLCYGDCIEEVLREFKIPYVIDYEDERLYQTDWDWEQHLQQYLSIGIPIDNVV